MGPLARAATEAPAYVLDPLVRSAVDDSLGNCRHHRDQHLLVYINCSHYLRHTLHSARKWQNTRSKKRRTVTRLQPSARKADVAKIGSKRAFRIILPDGFNISRAVKTSPIPRTCYPTSTVDPIFITIGGPQAHEHSLTVAARYRGNPNFAFGTAYIATRATARWGETAS